MSGNVIRHFCLGISGKNGLSGQMGTLLQASGMLTSRLSRDILLSKETND